MAAGNISSAAILKAAKESTAKIQGTDWIDIITNMANSGYSNNKRDNWFRTEGNTVSGSSTDTATTETVVDVAKVVKTLTKGENVATVDFDGVVSYVKTVDLLAGILRVMGFYDSKDVTVEKYAKELLNQIDFSTCDKLSENEVRTIISYLNSDAKILVERVAINDLYNQLVELGVTNSSGIANGSVADNTIFKSYEYPDKFYVRGEYNVTCLSKPKQYLGIKYDQMYTLLPNDVSNFLQEAISKLAIERPDLRQKLDDDQIVHYITLSYDNDNTDHNIVYKCLISFVPKNNIPFIAFGSSVGTREQKYDDTIYVNKNEALEEGGNIYRDFGDNDIYTINVPGIISWSEIEISPPIMNRTTIRYLIPRINSVSLNSDNISTDNIYRSSLGGVEIYYTPYNNYWSITTREEGNSHLTFNYQADVGLICPSSESELYTYRSGIFDNFTDGTNLPEQKGSTDRPNFKSRVDTSNNDLVGQLNMTTKNFGRYGTEGKIGDTVYAVFNSTAGDSSSSDENKNANKITDGNITKDQKDTIADDTSDANDSTKEEDKTGETNGTSNDGGIIPHIDFSYIAKRSMFNLYQVNQTTIKTLTDYLWSETFTNQLLKLYSNPMEAILGLYVLPVAASDVTKNVNVYVGNVDLNVNATLVNSYQQTYTAGVIDIAHYNHDVRDYSPYSQYFLYLPFIGIVELNADDVVGSKLTIYYDFDLCTGSILARIWVSRGALNACLYQFTGSCIYRLPVTQFDQANLVTVAANASLSALAGGLTGGPVRAGAQAVQQGFNSLQSHVAQGGSIGGNASIVASPYPYVIIKHRTPQTPTNFNKFYGRPTLKTVTLNKEKGFVKVKDINLYNINLTSDELNELESTLKEGVIL